MTLDKGNLPLQKILKHNPDAQAFYLLLYNERIKQNNKRLEERNTHREKEVKTCALISRFSLMEIIIRFSPYEIFH